MINEKKTIGIVSVGVGNVGAIVSSMQKLDLRVKLISSASDFEVVDAFIIPGVGSFNGVMRALDNAGITNTIRVKVLEDKLPVLGICAGYQIFFSSSEEAEGEPGLNILSGQVKSLSNIAKNIKIPNVGWTSLMNFREEYRWANADFYFDHSYFVQTNKNNSTGEIYVNAGIEPITVLTIQNNIWGAQFHPEKSSTNGLKFLRSFTDTINYEKTYNS